MTKEEKAAYNKAYYKAYHEANKEKIAAKGKAHYQANKDKSKAYREANKEKIAAKGKAYREANKEKIAARQKAYYESNKEKINTRARAYSAANRDKTNAPKKAWREANRGYQAEYQKNRISSDPIFAMKLRIQSLIGLSLSKNGFTKKSRTHEIIGCDYETFKEHIESRFLDGMSWENRDEWHIDHIIPLGAAQDEEAIITLNHYLNLRPLWAAENIAKKDKMPSMDLIKKYGADVIFNKLKGI